MDATCHSGGDMLATGQQFIVEETKESTNKKNPRRRSAAAVSNSASKGQEQGPTQEGPEEQKMHSSQIENLLQQPPAVINRQWKRYIFFRPYIDPISIRPYKP